MSYLLLIEINKKAQAIVRVVERVAVIISSVTTS
jgi:hypothetical protein